MPPASAIGALFASSVAKDNNVVQARVATSGSLGWACTACTVDRMLVGSNLTWQEQQPISGRAGEGRVCAGKQACVRGDWGRARGVGSG